MNNADFVLMSIDVAHEHIKLGRSEKAVSILSQVFANASLSLLAPETRVTVLLCYSESLAAAGRTSEGWVHYAFRDTTHA